MSRPVPIPRPGRDPGDLRPQGPAPRLAPVEPTPEAAPATPSIPALLERLAELSSMRATIAQEEARNFADLARMLDMRLAGSAAQSVTSPVPQPSPVSAPSASAMLDQQGVAALLGCSPRTVRRLEQGGELPASVLVGGLKRWPRTDLEAWLAQRHGAGRMDR